MNCRRTSSRPFAALGLPPPLGCRPPGCGHRHAGRTVPPSTNYVRPGGKRPLAKSEGRPIKFLFFFARWRRSVWPTPWPQGGLAPNRKGFSQKVKLRSKSGKQTRAERAESEQKASRKRAESKKSKITENAQNRCQTGTKNAPQHQEANRSRNQ